MYGECWHLKLNMFLKQSIWSTNKLLREIAVLECENAKFFKARSLRSLAYIPYILISQFPSV